MASKFQGNYVTPWRFGGSCLIDIAGRVSWAFLVFLNWQGLRNGEPLQSRVVDSGSVQMVARVLRVVLVLLPVLMGSLSVRAQVPVPTAGTHFTFGIVEGPDAAITPGELQSELYLTVLSPHDGCGLITSPSGYSQQFSFVANVPMRVGLDYGLMQTFELGKSKKGLLLRTSQPVNAYFHDWTKSGGDATQIFPDEALDTTYVVGGWGLYNDPGEQNHACVLVAAAYDGTDVVLVPSVNAIGGILARQPITVRLDRGETYILKADITSQPSSTSLSGTSVVSSRPVAVFSGVTCAYVPIGQESCNELLDQLLGKKWWTQHYFAQPLGNGDSTARLILTSDQDFFASMNGAPAFSSNARIETSFDRPVEITSNRPIQVQQIVGGSQVSGTGVGDPSLVTLFGAEHYADTLLWSIPNLGMANFAPIVVRTADIPQITFDGQPLTLQGTPVAINGSAYSAVRFGIYPGAHRLESPGGVFTMGVGFDIFDAFTYVAGSVLPELPRDTVRRTLIVSVDSAATCDTFAVRYRLDSALTESSGTTDLSLTLGYDPALMALVSFTPAAALQGAGFTIDTSVPGTIRIHVNGKPVVLGDSLFTIVYFGRASGSATLTSSLTAGACGENTQVFVGDQSAFTIRPNDLTMPRTFFFADSTKAGHVTCQEYVLTLVADTTLTARDRFVPISIEYVYPSPDEDLVSASLSDLVDPRLKATRDVPGHIAFDLTGGASLTGGDTLATFIIEPQRTGAHRTKAIVRYTLCGDTLSKEFEFDLTVDRNIDSVHAKLGIVTSVVTWGNESSADISLSGLPIDARVKDFTLDVQYNHDVLTFNRWEAGGTLTSGWTITGPVTVLPNTDRFTFTSSAAELGVSGPLVHLLFRTYVSDSASTPIEVSSSLTGSASCPVLYIAPQARLVYAGRDLCGDSLVRRFLRGQTIGLRAVHANPAGIDVDIIAHESVEVTLSIIDVLGHFVSHETATVSQGSTALRILAPLQSGSYVVRIEAAGVIRSKNIQVIR